METVRSDLVDRVVEEVVKRLRPPVLCLFTGGTGSLETVSQQLGQIAGLPCRYRCAFSRAAGKILGKRFADALKPVDCIVDGEGEASPLELVASSKIVVVPVLCQNTAVKAALGIRDSLASEILACAFLMGKRVILVKDSIAVSGVPAAYGGMLSGHLTALEGYGARVIAAEALSAEVAAALRGEAAPDAEPQDAEHPVPEKSEVSCCGAGSAEPAAAATLAPAAKPGSKSRKRLVDWRAAEAWVQEHGIAGQFVIPAGAIVTPLAVDYFKEKRIQVVRGTCAPSGGGSPC